MHTTTDYGIPLLGFGTYQLAGGSARNMVEQAIAVGYRHIDTAQMYGNEREVGQAIASAAVPRDQIFLTTKIWPDHFAADDFKRAAQESLQNLGGDAVDLLLLHWPNPRVPLEETLTALMWAQDQGLARLIGVSNFTTTLMRQAVEICGRDRLINNQVEYHPFLNQDRVMQTARSLGMTVTAYRPVAKGKVFKDPVLTGMAEKYRKNAAQITLRWLLQQGIITIPRTSNIDHLQQNFDVFDFELAPADMTEISSLRGDGRLVSPSNLAPDWD